MTFKISSIAAAILAVTICWSARAQASCQQCPEGYECHIPEDLGPNFGSCRAVVTPEQAFGDQTCLCENTGIFRNEVKYYPCPCILPSNDAWDWNWKWLHDRIRSPDPEVWSESLDEIDRIHPIPDGGADGCPTTTVPSALRVAPGTVGSALQPAATVLAEGRSGAPVRVTE